MRPNPALAEMAPLIGTWRMRLHDAAFLGNPAVRVAGSMTVAWIEGGAAVAMRQGDGEAPPAAVWIVGRDADEDDHHVLYADTRGVSRVYRMRLSAERWSMWRMGAPFSQRYEATIAPDGRTIEGHWERSSDGGRTWAHDFRVTYVRAPVGRGV